MTTTPKTNADDPSPLGAGGEPGGGEGDSNESTGAFRSQREEAAKEAEHAPHGALWKLSLSSD